MLKFSFGLLNLKKKLWMSCIYFVVDMYVLKVGKCVNFIMYYYCIINVINKKMYIGVGW